MFSFHSLSSIPIAFFLLPYSITLTLIHFHSNPLIPFHFIISIHFLFLFDSSFSHIQLYTRPSLSLAHFHLIHSYSHSSIFYPTHTINIVSLLLIYLSQLWVLYHVCWILVIACSFVVLIRNTLSQLDVIAFTSDGWIESSGIEL